MSSSITNLGDGAAVTDATIQAAMAWILIRVTDTATAVAVVEPGTPAALVRPSEWKRLTAADTDGPEPSFAVVGQPAHLVINGRVLPAGLVEAVVADGRRSTGVSIG